MKIVERLFIHPIQLPDGEDFVVLNKIDEKTKSDFLSTIFLNFQKLLKLNTGLVSGLLRRKTGYIVEKIGDVVLNFFTNNRGVLVDNYVEYAGGHVLAKNVLGRERKKGGDLINWIEVFPLTRFNI